MSAETDEQATAHLNALRMSPGEAMRESRTTVRQLATKDDLDQLEEKLLAAMNMRALTVVIAILGGMWGLLELYL